jgi:hypothetical protein
MEIDALTKEIEAMCVPKMTRAKKKDLDTLIAKRDHLLLSLDTFHLSGRSLIEKEVSQFSKVIDDQSLCPETKKKIISDELKKMETTDTNKKLHKETKKVIQETLVSLTNTTHGITKELSSLDRYKLEFAIDDANLDVSQQFFKKLIFSDFESSTSTDAVERSRTGFRSCTLPSSRPCSGLLDGVGKGTSTEGDGNRPCSGDLRSTGMSPHKAGSGRRQGTNFYICGKMDGIETMDNNCRRIIEIKNRTRGFFGEIRDYEMIQVQLYMFMTDISNCRLIEDYRLKLQYFDIERDSQLIDEILEDLLEFINNFKKFLGSPIEIKRNYIVSTTQEKKQFLESNIVPKEKKRRVACLL